MKEENYRLKIVLELLSDGHHTRQMTELNPLLVTSNTPSFYPLLLVDGLSIDHSQ